MRQDANTTNAGETLRGVEVVVWQAYLVGLAVSAVALVAFPPRRWALTRTRHRAVLTAITEATLGFAVPVFLLAAKLGVREAASIALICCLPGVIILIVYGFVRGEYKKDRRIRQERSVTKDLISQGDRALSECKQQLAALYPHMLHKYNADDESLLCMDAAGSELRFVQIGAHAGQLDRKADFRVPVSDIVSVELIKNEHTYTEATTVTKKRGGDRTSRSWRASIW